MGNALIGRLLRSYLDLGGHLTISVETVGFEQEAGRVAGVTLQQNGQQRSIAARNAVVLAGGGFGRNPELRATLLPSTLAPYSPLRRVIPAPCSSSHCGMAHRYGANGQDNAFWAPVSTRRRADGSTAVFPHFVLDRSKPGTICVNQRGERFTNESASYHLFGRAMIEAHEHTPTVPCWIIADAEACAVTGSAWSGWARAI